MSDIEYVVVMHDGSRSTRFMSEDYCKHLMEQLAAAQSKEVCTVAHSDEVMEFCPYCKIERLRGLLKSSRFAVAIAITYSVKAEAKDYYRNLLTDIDAELAADQPPASDSAAPTATTPTTRPPR